jgi:NDP-sugar pyrophosphorylase family protein
MREYRHTVPFGVMEMEGSRVLSLREKPSLICQANTGVYVLEPRLLERIPRDAEFTMPELIDDCLGRGEAVGGFSIHGDWVDVGRPADLYAATGAV